MRMLAIPVALIVASLVLACDLSSSRTEDPTLVVAYRRPLTRGYVMARWNEEIPQVDPGECPDGFNLTEQEYYPEQYAAYNASREAGDPYEKSRSFLPPDACRDPLAQPDPGFLILEGPAVVYGLDLDGVDSSGSPQAGARCAHRDFTGPDGITGVDDQYWRLMGCVRGYRPNESMDRLYKSNSSVKEGGFAILLEVSGMDDPKNDAEVEVQLISANAPVRVDAVGGIMQNVSVTVHEDARYHNRPARGKIVNGILTTEPIDWRIKSKKQTSDNEYWLRDARIRAEVLEDGRLKGLVGAYWDTNNFFSMMNDQRYNEKIHLGRIAAQTRGFMCAGMYHAMLRVADGHPDPETGQCTSISTTIHFEAVPAFVIRPQLALGD
jgi:hypothetical protein